MSGGMSGVEYFGYSISVLSSIVRVTNLLQAIGEREQQVRLRSKYGWFLTELLVTCFPGVLLRTDNIERNILRGSDENAKEFKNSIVAVTAQSVDNLSNAHWIARAFWILSIVSSLLSVHYACVLQKTIGQLYGPAQVRDWLSANETRQKDQSLEKEAMASIAAIITLGAPVTMALCSIWFFITRLCIYLAFVWLRNLDQDAGIYDSRNVFMALTGIGVCYMFFTSAFQSKDVETLILRTQRKEIEPPGREWIVDNDVYDYVTLPAVNRGGGDIGSTAGVSSSLTTRNQPPHELSS